MLDLKILKLGHGISYGSVTLKSLQNENIPDIDLLVREAIQNSSDAALNIDFPFYKVGFKTGYFSPSGFNSYLSEAEALLNKRYPSEREKFLEIRDTKTTGLTGNIRISEIDPKDHGNFFKLIYDTGKMQTQAGAGGSWGFGKSVYYRVGSGIVLFYSRIKSGSEYESRLIITLVEDENGTNPILKNLDAQSVGKAWWGIRENDDFLPITQEEFIIPILDIFGLSPFTGEETGTSVVIPFIDTDRLMKNIIPEEINIPDEVRERCTWADNFEQYLGLSVQKWYAPRIQNKHLARFCKLKRLNVYINEVPIRYDDMLPLYQIVQELYTTSLAKTYSFDYTSDLLKDCCYLPVYVRDYFNTDIGDSNSGYVTMIKVSNDVMNKGQSYVSPYIYLRHFECDPSKNDPIVMFAREPGMVIDYAISGQWVKGIAPPESPNEYILAFYVPITEKRTKKSLSISEYSDKELGRYLRSCEASDHMGWKDPSGMKIVDRIQRNTAAQIAKKYDQNERKPVDATPARLSGWLGKRLLPKVGYIKKPPQGGGGGGGGGGGSSGVKISDFKFTVDSYSRREGDLVLDFTSRFQLSKKTARITIIIDSEEGWIDPNTWEDVIGTPFPVEIREVRINSITYGDEQKSVSTDIKVMPSMHESETEMITLRLEDESAKRFSCFSIETRIINLEIHGQLLISAEDRKYSFTFKVE